MQVSLRRALAVWLASLLSLTIATVAQAAPEAHILRIDPRAAVVSGTPLLTTLVEVVQFNPLSQIMTPCANVAGANATIDCISENLEKPSAIWSPLPFLEPNASLLVKVEGADTLATLAGPVERWGDAVKRREKGIGTSWLILLDASSSMGNRYAEGRAVARQFIEAMQPADLMRLMIFDDRLVIQDSQWKTFAQRNDLVGVLNAQPAPAPSHGRDRTLFDLLKKMTADAFGSLGNTQGPQEIPLHQAEVILSNGAGRNDPSSISATATVFKQFVTKGRFPDEATSTPKTPLPIISIWMPNAGGLVNDVFRNNDQQFMQELANPEIGGFFDIVREGQGEAKGKKIIELVRGRFNAMYLAKWKLSCLNPTLTQSFDLEFRNVKTPIKGDATFKDVPIGIDPTQWPLDIDLARTKAEADANPVHPGGTMKVYGTFCWGGDSKRAEAYFVPAGTKPDPNIASTDVATVRRIQQNLIAQNMRGGAREVNESFAVFDVPDEEKLLEGTGEAMVTRVLVYDNGAHRGSGHDEQTVLTLKAEKKPFNLLLILGIAGAVIVLLLLVLVLMRGGGGGKGKRGTGGGGGAPLAPVVAGGPPPGGGYGGPPGGGYGGPPQGGYGGAPPMGGGGAPPGGGYGGPQFAPVQPVQSAPIGGAPAAVVQVRCPHCSSMTMVTPGQPSVCFSCGQPLPANIAEGGGGAGAPMFPLTGGMPAQPVPPPNPYIGIAQAILSGGVGDFTIKPGDEVKVGRDPSLCPVMLPEPRVSGVHATLKLEGQQLWVRDETSNNGTYVGGARIAPGVWTPVPSPGPLRFGPIEFAVRVQ
ncbi:MAG: FHA domain-containing protein [Polyangiaceae bacterium]